MNFKPRQREEINVDLTPLIDVVFLLLIFFMVSTTFSHTSEVNITLPTSSKEGKEAKLNVINIGLTVDGTVFINSKPLLNAQLATIKTALSEALVGLDEPSIIINADADATHQSVVRVMDAARQIGVGRITFATQERSLK